MPCLNRLDKKCPSNQTIASLPIFVARMVMAGSCFWSRGEKRGSSASGWRVAFFERFIFFSDDRNFHKNFGNAVFALRNCCVGCWDTKKWRILSKMISENSKKNVRKHPKKDLNKILKIQSNEDNSQNYFWEYRFWEWNHVVFCCLSVWTLGPPQKKWKHLAFCWGFSWLRVDFVHNFRTNLQVTSFRQRMLRLLPQDQATWMPSKDSLHQKTCWDVFSHDISETLSLRRYLEPSQDQWVLLLLGIPVFLLNWSYSEDQTVTLWTKDHALLHFYRAVRVFWPYDQISFIDVRIDCLTSIDIISMWYWQRNLWSCQPAANDSFVLGWCFSSKDAMDAGQIGSCSWKLSRNLGGF